MTDTTALTRACSTVVFRAYELPRALDTISALGIPAADLAALAGLCEHVPPRGSRADLRAIAGAVRGSGLAMTSVNADPGSFNGAADAALVLDRIDALLEFCADVAVPRLVLTCGDSEQSDDADRELGAVADGLNRAAEIAAGYPVELVVEAPHYFRLVNTMPRARVLLARLSPEIGQAWDVSHVRASGADPVPLFAEFAERVSIIHLRDAVPGDIRRAIGHGDVDFAGVLAEAAIRPEVPLVLELETHDSPFETKEEEVQDALTKIGFLGPQARITGVSA